MKPLRVEVWSDIACPWCWVGKRHLEQAIAGAGDLGDVEVVSRAFELDPAAPQQPEPGLDLVARLARKYGASMQQAQQMIDRMTQVGAADGLDFRFDRVVPVRTFDAHRLLHWAALEGRQPQLVEALFRAYMHEGRAVSDHEVLVELAAQAGLDPERARATLAGDAYTQEVRAEQKKARELGITGVPFFVVDGRYGISGAQPAAVLRKVLEQARSEQAEQAPAADDPLACGPDGCDVPA
ncbi:MAG: DsbA family oxidoreductase [Deltaproteobacteria bacterium]|nr:DsbA family oxidoreductase [Deltaproteobacteria bacterium]